MKIEQVEITEQKKSYLGMAGQFVLWLLGASISMAWLTFVVIQTARLLGVKI